MNVRAKTGILVALVLTLALVGGCEDSDITAPTGSQLTLVATPASVPIDQDGGEISGSTTLVAQLVDAGGLPLSGVRLFFSTNGGFLGSVDNFCKQDSACGDLPLPSCECTRTATPCSTNGDCPLVTPLEIKTDQNGVAVDTLTLRLIGDPDTVTVTVHATTLNATVTVGKNVNLGPTDPKAVFTINPSDGQRIGKLFVMDGTGSTFDPEAELTCFQWTIDSDKNVSDQVARGPNFSTFQLALGTIDPLGNPKADEQDLVIRLQVSSVKPISCSSCGGPFPPCTTTLDPALFKNSAAVKTYLIRCDPTNPEVEIGPNKTKSLTDGNPAKINVTAIAEDPEDTELTYQWDCGDLGTIEGPGDQQTVTCSYGAPGGSTISVSVQNDCGGVSQDSLSVTIVN